MPATGIDLAGARKRASLSGSRPESRPPSPPAMICKTSAVSQASRAIGPTLSIVGGSAIAPARLTRPNVGRRPVTPQKADGHRMLPQVSVPIAKPTSPAATAEPEPEDEPPDQRVGPHGVRAAPVREALPVR